MSKIGRLSVATVAAASVLVAGSSVGVAVATTSSVPFVVNSTADRGDAVLNGVCQTSVVGECTLRAAIQEADATAGTVTIGFNIPGSGVHTISPQTALPSLNNGKYGITIDGFSQPGSAPNIDSLVDRATRTIELVGPGSGSFVGLELLGPNNVVRGLDIHSFGIAVRMTGSSAGNNVLEGDLIGLMPNGNVVNDYRYVKGAPCVVIQNGAHTNHIGAAGDANRNVISGCYEKGITLLNPHTSNNFVQNNIIGLDPTGTQRRSNENIGVDVDWSANHTMIGGTFPEHNVISGNVTNGVEIGHGTGTVYNSIVGNYIGTDPTGNSATRATRNTGLGVDLAGKPNCNNKACPPDEGLVTVTDNVIVNSGQGGIEVHKGVHDSLIARNRIGVMLNGTLSSTARNVQWGIMIDAGETRITIGPGNEIAGSQQGIQMTPLGLDPVSSVPSPTEYNTVTQNSIHDIGSSFGIDLRPYEGNPILNEGIAMPVLTASAGLLSAQTCAGCKVEVFTSSAAPGAFGPGVTYLMTVVADSNGKAAFSTPAGGWPPAVTATATTPLGSTSEFAQNIVP